MGWYSALMNKPLTSKLAQATRFTSPAVDAYDFRGGPFVRGAALTPDVHARTREILPTDTTTPAPLSDSLRRLLYNRVRNTDNRLREGVIGQRGAGFGLPTFRDDGRKRTTGVVIMPPYESVPTALHEFTHAADPLMNTAQPASFLSGDTRNPQFVADTGRVELPAMVPETLSHMRGEGLRPRDITELLAGRRADWEAAQQVRTGEAAGKFRAVNQAGAAMSPDARMQLTRAGMDDQLAAATYSTSAQRLANLPRNPEWYYRMMERYGPMVGTPNQRQQRTDAEFQYGGAATPRAGQQYAVMAPPVKTDAGWTESSDSFDAQLANVRDWVKALRDPSTNLGRAHAAWAARSGAYEPRPVTPPAATGVQQ